MITNSVMQVAEARLYEKTDKYGARYKVEIKQKSGGKVRQVKCRMDFIPSSVQETRVQFTQQQGKDSKMYTMRQVLI